MPDRCSRRGLGRFALAAALCASLPAALSVEASQRFAGRGEIEVAFTPRDDAESLLVGVIGQARRSLHVQAYAFTNRRIADAMVKAHRRGVNVQVLADERMNRREKGNALPRLLAAGVPVALETKYNAAHNKVLIVNADGPGCAVVTGSFNFTWSAQNRNSENVLILRGHCEVARAYRDNWLQHRRDAVAVTALPLKR